MKNFPGKTMLRRSSIGFARRKLRCVFVLSTGRVGTDSLTKILNLAPNIRASHEPHPRFSAETKIAHQQSTSSSDVPRQLLNARLFTTSQRSGLRECLVRGLIYVETSNRMTYVAKELYEFFPNSKFIHLHRNPADVIRSAMRRNFYDCHVYDQFRIEPRDGDPHKERWQEWPLFEKCCWYWQTVNKIAMDFASGVDRTRIFDLPSDVLFEKNIEKLTAMFDWIGAIPPSKEKIKNALKVKNNSQEQNEFPKWGEWNEEYRERMARIVKPVAVKLGYDNFVNFKSTK